MARFVDPNPVFFDERTRDRASNGYLVFTENETEQPKVVYLDPELSQAANNEFGEIRLNADAQLPELVYYDGLATVRLLRANKDQIWALDGVAAGGGGMGTGSSTAAQFLEFRYIRSSTQPPQATGDNPTGWSTTPPSSGTNPIWLIQGLKIIETNALVGSWSAPVRLSGDPGASGILDVQYSADGVTGWHGPPVLSTDRFIRFDEGAGFGPAIQIVGENGADGPFISYIFQRSATQPATPPANDPNPAGWSDAAPVAPAALPLWITSARISADETTVLVPWGTPVNIRGDDGAPGADGVSLIVEYSPNGVDSWHGPPAVATDRFIRQRRSDGSFGAAQQYIGEDGQDGLFVSIIFIRAATRPATPGDVADPPGWSDGIPSGTLPVWLSRANKATGNILITPWSTPERISGEDGVGLLVQYSPDGVTGWHGPPFVLGDQFFRLRTLVTDPWGPAARIVGENGVDGPFTEFLFRRRAVDNAPPAPTGNNPPDWFDDPSQATGTGVLWFTRGQKTAQGNLIGLWSTPVQLESVSTVPGPPGASPEIRRNSATGPNGASVTHITPGGTSGITLQATGTLTGTSSTDPSGTRVVNLTRNGVSLPGFPQNRTVVGNLEGPGFYTWDAFPTGLNIPAVDSPPAGTYTYVLSWSGPPTFGLLLQTEEIINP